jgi:pimeloyl-ACP methyl ester carboxylesterase
MPDKIYFHRAGHGEPLLLLHGFCETHEVWNRFVNQLKNQFNVVAVDLPGFGQSSLPAGNFSLEEVAASIRQQLEQLEWKQFVVVGHSLGGYVALAMARFYPELLKGLVLFHSTALEDSPEKKESRSKVMEFLQLHGAEAFIKPFVPPLFYNPQHPAIPEVVDIALRGSRVETLIQYTRAMRERPDSSPVLSDFGHPILFLAGQKDSTIPAESLYNQALTCKKGTFLLLPEVAHMGMFEAPALTLPAIELFSRFCYNR